MNTPGLIAATAVGVAALTLGACAPDDLELPAPPPMDDVVAAYDNPTGTIDTARLDQVRADAQARVDALPLDWLPELVSGLAARLRERLSGSGLATNPGIVPDDERPIIDAVARVHHVCKGFADPPGPPAPAQNGTLDLTAVVEDGRLRRVIWGTGAACHQSVDVGERVTVDAVVDGTLAIYLLGSLPTGLADAQLLVSFTGTAGVMNERVPQIGSFDFRLQNGVLEVRVPVSDGEIIVGVGSGMLTLRGRNATYSCAPAAGTCVTS